ncbi:MAG: hypothetical protein K6T55_00255 [Syntrophobacterales bacterium]|nr:hypothetical protein [Syntrophobacterales bacterium]
MPYIPSAHRPALDEHLDHLAAALVREAESLPGEAAIAGLLNYALTRLILKVVQLRFGAWRYWLIALVTGVLHNVADELYRRLAAPYEDLQRQRHGDVPEYAHFLRKSESWK